MPGSYQVPRWLRSHWKSRPESAERVRTDPRAPPDAVAVVGVSARLPMAADIGQLWSNLLAGRDCVTRVPPGRWDWQVKGRVDEHHPGIDSGGWLDGIEDFDSLFFNISPHEATIIDPQQRLLMMHVWQAMEDSGHAPHSFAGTHTGVFVGALGVDFIRLVTRANRPAEGYTSTGTVPSVGASRVSHFFDLRGPCETIETACSSALVAMHRAVRAIQGGECDTAITGAVNLLLTPDLSQSFSNARMLSPDGRCKPFSRDANGYVRGEGVGVLVLKKLSLAERDGDQIHCVIRSTAENHSGRSRSLTAPNPEAQADLLCRAYSQIDVDPATVGYIESHGTGTPLGDPIEIEAMKAAFDRLYRLRGAVPKVGHCGVGSLKSNVGHLEIAAGVAGFIKVLLQLKHRVLVPTLHCESVNSHVILEGSPFYLVRETQPWEPVVENGRALPRRAGVSSFGFGGVNAHVVLEEYLPAARAPVRSRHFPILLSARDADGLRRRAAALLEDLEKIGHDEQALLDTSFTLACGREPMPQRLAFLATSIGETKEKLTAFLGRASEAPNLDALADERIRRWVAGEEVHWRAVFDTESPRRRSLTPYAFSLKKFPLPRPAVADSAANPSSLGVGELPARRVDLPIAGSEFFIAHHTIGGEPLFPAVMYLEAVRAAFEPSVRQFQLLDVIWLAPLVVREPVTLSIWLHPAGPKSARFEAGLHAGEASAPTSIHATGTIAMEQASTPPVLDLTQVRRRCAGTIYSQEQCYQAFTDLGFNYGPGLRTLQSLSVGDGEILARLALENSQTTPAEQFVLHPAILDGALQAIIGLQMSATSGWRIDSAARPFKCASVQVFSDSRAVQWASVRGSAGHSADVAEKSFDIDLCNDAGEICIRFRSLTVRSAAADRRTRELMLTPRWLPQVSAMQDVAPARPGATVVIGGTEEEGALLRRLDPDIHLTQLAASASPQQLRDALENVRNIAHILWLVPANVPASLEDDAIVTAQHEGVLFGLNLVQAMLALGYGAKALAWTAVTRGTHAVHDAERGNPTHAGVHGLIGSTAREYSHWSVRSIDVSVAEELPVDALLQPFRTASAPLAYRDRQWLARRWCVVEQMTAHEPAFAAGAVYVIVGGTGGIGQALSRALMEESAIQLVWIGRRPLDAYIEAMIAALAPLGRAPLYVCADASDREQLARARDLIENKFGRIDGLIQAAMVLRDQSLERMSAAAFREALVPKMDASICLAQVFATAELDFVLFFSSINSFATLAGQSNYAAGSCFEDAYALELSKLWRCRVRVINWGYWGEVGAVASDFHRSHMSRLGIASIEIADAMRAMRRILAGPLTQCGYIKIEDSADLDLLAVDQDHRVLLNEPSDCYRPAARLQNIAWQEKDLRHLVEEQAVVDDLLRAGLWEELRKLCNFDAPISVAAARKQAGIHERYLRWFERSVDELIAHGFLASDRGLVSATAKARTAAANALPIHDLPALLVGDAQRATQWRFVQTTLRSLPEILTGARESVEVMFSEPTATHMAESYRDDPAVLHCSRVLASIVADFVSQRIERDPQARIRLLEVGAGRGATTRWVVDALRPYQHAIAEYAFTDISPAFLSSDRNAQPNPPDYQSYRKFDVEKDPEGQGIARGAYDIVIAANVLHATRNLEQTLLHCKACLKGGGILLLHELASNPLFAHLTYGLLEGWWRYDDSAVRLPGGPAAQSAAWRERLGLTGYRQVFFPAQSARPISHQVIVAESDGVLLLPRAASTPSTLRKTGMQVDDLHVIPNVTEVDELLPELKRLVAQVLGMEEADLDQPSRPFAEAMLSEIGMDSLSSISLRNSLRHKFDVDIPVQHILGQRVPTIAGAVYNKLLLRRLATQSASPDSAATETFTF